jgi:DNA-binding NarL/FixJ family response regulator
VPDRSGCLRPTPLTARQRQIHELVVKGLSNKAIAHVLGIQESTVKAHVTALMRRLGVISRTEATLQHPLDPD